MHRDMEKWLAWQRRSKRLKSGKPPRRKTKLRPINEARAEKKFARNFHSDERVAWVNEHCCAYCGRHDETIRNDHTKKRGNGGAGGDWTKILPACAECDDIHENRGFPALLRARGLTTADVEYQLAALMREWRMYERATVEVADAV